MGDGGCGIGGHHLINAARRNIGVTVLIFNNFNYGMTGGEHSATTPTGANTPTTQYGNLEHPMDICGTVAINGATFVARTTAFDKNLTTMMTEAIQHDGFSLIDIWELCTAYYVPKNRFSKRLLEETLSTSGFSSGIIQKVSRPEFSQAYHDHMRDQLRLLPLTEKPIKHKYSNKVARTMNWIVAGAAGKKIGSASSSFCRGAVLSGLWATQRNDHKITVKSGYSISEVIISPNNIQCTTITKANFLVVLFPEGLKKVFPQIHKLTEKDILYINNSLLPIETRAKIVGMDFRKTGKKKEFWAVMALAEILRNTNIYPLEAFIEAVSQRDEFSEKNLEAIETGKGLLIK
jgi:Pyruvate/2-oxoacid:ferredoxin oxidoreductase gamma subunit